MMLMTNLLEGGPFPATNLPNGCLPKLKLKRLGN
jgi:hypothetical protein